jgi:hypothetical protein
MRVLAGLSLRRRLLIGGGALTLVLALIVAFLFISGSDAAADQPIDFNHQAHNQHGIQCQFCHSGVNKSPVAGIPSVEKCMGCHTYVATESEEIQELAGYYERGEPIAWSRVNEQPRYVFFTHSSHMAAGVTCGACHGDVGNMQVAKEVANMNMGFCLDCHGDYDREALYDCAVCHR